MTSFITYKIQQEKLDSNKQRIFRNLNRKLRKKVIHIPSDFNGDPKRYPMLVIAKNNSFVLIPDRYFTGGL